MAKLVIDDLRILNLPGEVKYARSVTDALILLAQDAKWEEIYLDHDLGYNDGHFQDIWPVVAAFEERMTYNPIQTGQIFIITSNPVGSQRLKLAFDRMGYPTTVYDPKPILGGVLPW